MNEINTALEQSLSKIAQKAAKQPKIALRMLRRLPHCPVQAELAVKTYELNRRNGAKAKAEEMMREALRNGYE